MRPLGPAMALVAALGCGGSGSRGAGGTCPIPVARMAPTFSGDILPALQSSCGAGTATCHGTAAPAGHVEYATGGGRTASDVWRDLVNAVPANAPPGWLRVAPFDPGRSWLIAKITQDQPGGSGYGARMPYGGANVCQPTVDTLVAWINQGAPND
jgi:hypothetical protein